jgi:hypothetical protein
MIVTFMISGTPRPTTFPRREAAEPPGVTLASWSLRTLPVSFLLAANWPRVSAAQAEGGAISEVSARVEEQ